MVRTTTVLAGLLVFVAGCAAHPQKPDRPAPAAPAVSTAKLFEGCKVGRAAGQGYALDCGDLFLIVGVDAGTTPAKEVEKRARGLTRGLPGVTIRRTKRQIEVGTRSAEGVRLEFFKRATDASPTVTIEVTAVDASGGGAVGLACGWSGAADPARCPAMLGWLAAHPTAPPKVLAGHAEARAATPPTATQAAAWPPAADLVVPNGCDEDRLSPAVVVLGCGDVALELELKARHPLGMDTYKSMASLGDAARSMLGPRDKRKQGAPFPCTIGGKPGACFRHALPLPSGKSGVAFFGVGEMFGDTVLVTCQILKDAATVPAVCTGFIRATGPADEAGAHGGGH